MVLEASPTTIGVLFSEGCTDCCVALLQEVLELGSVILRDTRNCLRIDGPRWATVHYMTVRIYGMMSKIICPRHYAERGLPSEW